MENIKIHEKYHQYGKCFKAMKDVKYNTRGEGNNLQNISAI